MDSNKWNAPRRRTGTSQGGRRLSVDQIRRLEARIHCLPVMDHLCVRATVQPAGGLEVRLQQVEPFHLGGMEAPFLNGGILLGLLDCALVGAGLAHFIDHRCATLELSAHFMRPMRGEDLLVTGCVVQSTTRLAFAQAEARDAHHQLCARATGTISVISRTLPDPPRT